MFGAVGQGAEGCKPDIGCISESWDSNSVVELTHPFWGNASGDPQESGDLEGPPGSIGYDFLVVHCEAEFGVDGDAQVFVNIGNGYGLWCVVGEVEVQS